MRERERFRAERYDLAQNIAYVCGSSITDAKVAVEWLSHRVVLAEKRQGVAELSLKQVRSESFELLRSLRAKTQSSECATLIWRRLELTLLKDPDVRIVVLARPAAVRIVR